jgi:mono/diheme cytochrome c family protein
MRLSRSVTVLALGLTLLPIAPATGAAPDGAVLFREHCAPCHGTEGRGDGPDAEIFIPRPRDLRAGFLTRYSADTLVRMIRDGEALPLALDPAALRARAADVDALVAHVRRLSDLDWPRVERGRHVYVERCEPCHGIPGTPRTTAQAAPDLADPAFQRRVDGAALRALVRHGRPGMPALPELDGDDAGALVVYVRALTPGWVAYGRWCASCHGVDGMDDTLVDPTRAPRVVFDRAWARGAKPADLRSHVWHMLADQRPAMPHLRRRLGEAEVRAIVDWLRGPP